jgi:hypothetical protein
MAFTLEKPCDNNNDDHPETIEKVLDLAKN